MASAMEMEFHEDMKNYTLFKSLAIMHNIKIFCNLPFSALTAVGQVTAKASDL